MFILRLSLRDFDSPMSGKSMVMLCQLLQELELLPDPFASVHHIHFNEDDRTDAEEFNNLTGGSNGNGAMGISVELQEASKLAGENTAGNEAGSEGNIPVP